MLTCPQPWQGGPEPTVFLAGGITDCWNWQAQAALELPPGLLLLNPRRPNWPIGDPTASAGQIAWEHEHLRIADVILFWFTWETVQPITLFELGAHAPTGRRIAVGCHPKYPRRLDVLIQLGHARPDVPVRNSLRETCTDAATLARAAGDPPVRSRPCRSPRLALL
jgi:hypothetical protein